MHEVQKGCTSEKSEYKENSRYIIQNAQKSPNAPEMGSIGRCVGIGIADNQLTRIVCHMVGREGGMGGL